MMRGLVVGAAALVVAAGCSKPVPDNTLIFSPEGVSGDVNYGLEAFEVFEMNAADHRDTFELRGADACICGTLWPMTNFSEKGWQGLLGKDIDLNDRGGNPMERKSSSVKLDPWGGNTLSTGTLWIQKVEQAGDRVVVTGRMRYTFETSKGERRGIATFKVGASARRVNE